MSDHHHFMQQALLQAELAAQQDEVPVGAVITLNNQIIAAAHNSPITLADPTAHAEILALRQAAKHLNNYRLLDCELYVTLEPCVMCIGAMMHARIKCVIYGTDDPKTGAIKSVINIVDNKQLNHHLSVKSGILQEECSHLLKSFFKQKRLVGG